MKVTEHADVKIHMELSLEEASALRKAMGTDSKHAMMERGLTEFEADTHFEIFRLLRPAVDRYT